MTPTDVLTQARARGAILLADDGRLRVQNSKALPGNLRQAILEHKAAILDLLATPDHAKLVAAALALFPGSEVMADLSTAELEDALLRFCRLMVATNPNLPSTERLGEALRCLNELLPGGHAEAPNRVRCVALYVWEKLWSLTIGEMEALL